MNAVVPLHNETGLREKINAQVLESGVTQAQIAREAGLSQTALSRYLANSYEGNNAAVESKLQSWLEAVEARKAQREVLPHGPEFVETPSSERVITGLRYAQHAGDMVMIYGGAGTGKTKGVEEYARTSPNVWHVTMTPASGSVMGALQEIAEFLGDREHSSPYRMHKNICRRVKGTHGLLAVDEAQHLTTLALDQIRSIHDATGIGVALVGNEHVYARLTGGTRAAYLDRLHSRIGKRIYLKRSTEGDSKAIAQAWGIEDGRCQATVAEIASKPGALRVLSKVLRMALMLARASDRTICCDDVRAAWRDLGGEL